MEFHADIYSAYGCFQDTISLSCPDARTIFVTNAIYGQFLQSCSHEGIACCPPNLVVDCEEDLETNNQQDWQAIKDVCDNQTSCDFVNGGGYVPSCADPNVVDYMTVNYQCLPGELNVCCKECVVHAAQVRIKIVLSKPVSIFYYIDKLNV